MILPVLVACALQGDGTSICERAKLSSGPLLPGDAGFSVMGGADEVVLGAPDFGFGSHHYGGALVWVRAGMEWDLTQLIEPSDSHTQDRFGHSVAVKGDTLVVGASENFSRFEDSGAAYVFERDPQTEEWIEAQKLVPADLEPKVEFGRALALEGNVLAVSAQFQYARGAVYIFNKVGDEWQQVQVLSPSGTNGFGAALAIEDDTLLIGAIAENNFRGAAYVFEFDGQQWAQRQRIVAPDRQPGDLFGVDVAIGGNLIIVGASRDDVLDYDEGSARIFRYNGNLWAYEAMVIAPNPVPDFFFGDTVRFHQGAVLVGATLEDTFFPLSRGVVHRYAHDGNGWVHTHRLVPSDAAQGGGQAFGGAMAVHEDTLLVGASWDDDYGTNSGAGYVFDLSCSETTPATLTDVAVAFGTLISGGLAEILASDDQYLRARSHFGFTSAEPNVVDIRIGAETLVELPATFDLAIEGRLNAPNGTTKVRLRNWNTNQFQQVHQYQIGTSEITAEITDVDAAGFTRLSDGRIELSLRQSVMVVFSSAGFDSLTDWVEIAVE